MSAGIALADADREPFLRAVAEAIRAQRASGVVITCSALKRRYRDLLRELAGPVLFVHPQVERSQLVERLGIAPRSLHVSLAARQPAGDARSPLQR